MSEYEPREQGRGKNTQRFEDELVDHRAQFANSNKKRLIDDGEQSARQNKLIIDQRWPFLRPLGPVNDRRYRALRDFNDHHGEREVVLDFAAVLAQRDSQGLKGF